MAFRLLLLGGAALHSDEGPLRGRSTHRRRLGLLALLAAAGPPRPVARERLVATLWPEAREEAGRPLLSESLYVLRKELGDQVVRASGDAVALNPEVIDCDLVAFRKAAAEQRVQDAIELYAGPLLDGFFIEDAPDFERWLEQERSAVGREYARLVEMAAEQSESEGDTGRAVDAWARLSAHEPFDARVALRFMRALAGSGQRARAVQFAAAFSSRYRDELEMEPDPEVSALAARLRSEPAAPPSTFTDRPDARTGPVSASSGGVAASSTGGAGPARELTPFPATGAAPGAGSADLAAIAPEFEVVRLLGESSAARVYLAREPVLARLVAVKLLKEEFADDPTLQHRFEREARAAARIHHPFVATVFRVGRFAGGRSFLVMPYVSGGSLEDRLAASGPLPVPLARRFIGQIAAGLSAAHRLGIVHRDVRPANVLHDRETDRVLLTDFGIAAVLESGREEMLKLTLPGQQLGSPAYASPEQLRGDAVSERADVYSLAILGFEILTGRLPFDASTPGQLITAHARAEPFRASAFLPQIDPDLDDLLYRSLNKLPAHRPFALDLADALLTG